MEVNVMRKEANDGTPAGLDGTEKKLIGIMIIGALLMVGSGAWYLFS
jgi:hypothetical protein